MVLAIATCGMRTRREKDAHVVPKMLAALLALLGVCNDRTSSCYVWSLDGHCETNPEYMKANCPLSCGICEHNCTDTHEQCTNWAKQGECENNTDYMLRSCPTIAQ